jgi:hypothetical protein
VTVRPGNPLLCSAGPRLPFALCVSGDPGCTADADVPLCSAAALAAAGLDAGGGGGGGGGASAGAIAGASVAGAAALAAAAAAAALLVRRRQRRRAAAAAARRPSQSPFLADTDSDGDAEGGAGALGAAGARRLASGSSSLARGSSSAERGEGARTPAAGAGASSGSSALSVLDSMRLAPRAPTGELLGEASGGGFAAGAGAGGPVDPALLENDWAIAPEALQLLKRPDGSDHVLGAGGFGTVYKALRDGVQEVAVKVIPLGRGASAAADAAREVAILRACRDANIVQFQARGRAGAPGRAALCSLRRRAALQLACAAPDPPLSTNSARRAPGSESARRCS